jgi:hypothetical protein
VASGPDSEESESERAKTARWKGGTGSAPLDEENNTFVEPRTKDPVTGKALAGALSKVPLLFLLFCCSHLSHYSFIWVNINSLVPLLSSLCRIFSFLAHLLCSLSYILSRSVPGLTGLHAGAGVPRPAQFTSSLFSLLPHKTSRISSLFSRSRSLFSNFSRQKAHKAKKQASNQEEVPSRRRRRRARRPGPQGRRARCQV